MDEVKPNSRIHVCARLRPVIQEDFKLGTTTRTSPELCVHLKHDGQTIKMTKDVYDVKLFRVDHTFDAVATQQDVYNSSFKNIVTDALNGYNGTCLAYGQTGSGKSYTMFGVDKNSGVVQLAVNDVFEAVRKHIAKNLVANVFLSFYQLYLEQAYDLLVGPVGGKLDCTPLGIREDAVKGTYVENLQYLYVDDATTTIEVLKQGLKNRKVQATQYNMSSSRSHAIFQMYLDFEEDEEEVLISTSSGEKKHNGNGIDSDNGSTTDLNSEFNLATQSNNNNYAKNKIGKKKFDVRRRILTFVDLAGSERVQNHHQAKSKAQFKESITINKSISALGNCIQALASNSSQHHYSGDEASNGFNIPNSSSAQLKKNSHIPFRDCKLTRLLAEPLGGNSKTCIIVNIGPCFYNYEETRSTLKFAQR